MTKTELVQTKNSFKLIGKVTRIDKDGAYKEEVMSKGAKEGELYRALRFGVKTSETNEITTSTFDFEPKEIFMWNSEKKKADANYKGDRIPYGQWEQQQEELREQGYSVLQTRIGLNTGDDGKIVSKGLPSFVASEEIYNNVNNGDSVVIEGEIRYSKWKNNQDEEVEQKQYTIRKVFKLTKDIDFTDEKFEEVSYFEQEMVFIGADVDKKEGKVYVTGRVIDFAKKFHDTQMIVNFKDDEGNIDAGMVKLAEAFTSRFKFGDIINVFGDTLNRVIIKEATEEESPKDDLFADFGGRKKPQHAQGYTARTYVTEMSIYGVDKHDKGVYTEDDFVKDELIDNGNSAVSEFGGKAKKNPFDLGEGVEISDDDLPF